MITGVGLIHQPTTVEENMSNLTCASSVSNSSNRNENSGSISQQPIKKKRNQPGHPDPGAEVIALSPRTLTTTNRFVCDVCNKGFKRDQNLQLHRRGHNLPWKLKQKSNKEVGRKVYICPEMGCVHHDPSRALGDLTGIKKHFYRKHGEKKWKCDKCYKKYAVQSDCKAHSKICGTREYRCHCGTLFSRRDSFITHRAFCDALAQENGGSIFPLQYAVDSLPFQIKKEHQNLMILKQEIPPWLSCSPIIGASLGPPSIDLTTTPSLILQDFPQNHHHHNPNPNPSCNSLGPTTLPPFHPPPPHISATALLQKASQMGAKSSTQPFPHPDGGATTRPHQADHVTADHSPTYGFGPSRDQLIHTTPSHHLAHDMMTMMMNSAGSLGFDDIAFGQMLNSHPSSKDHHMSSNRFHASEGQFGNEGENLTRDFLGLSQNDIISMTGLDSCINENPKSWQG